MQGKISVELFMGTAVIHNHRASRTARPTVLRGLVITTAFAAATMGGAAVWFYWRARACLPQLDGVIQLPGLAAAVQIIRDDRGVPHIRAQSLDDLVFAQGYVTAQDRLWQMDLSRRLAQGELSEIFGKRTLEYDVENRALGFPEVLRRAVNEMDSASRHVLAVYARGVNALISSHQDRLPVEFTLLRYRPRPWSEADSIGIALNMTKVLNSSWRTDLMRERIRKKLPPQLYADIFPDRSLLDRPVADPVSAPIRVAHPDATGALRLAAAGERTKTAVKPEHVRRARHVSRVAISSRRDAEAAGQQRAVSLPAEASGGSTWGGNPEVDSMMAEIAGTGPQSEPALGSNNWVVSGAHTRSGRPLLVNDPHLRHSVPSVWYQIELNAPNLHVAGVSLPGGPLVVIGHNERIAWGMTNTGPDVQDIYLETFNPNDPNKYLVNGRWVEAQRREERIRVRGAPDTRLTIRVTRHGPVLGEDGSQAIALKWTALQPHALTFTLLRIDQARNWQEFTEAIRHFTGPEQNMVYGDVDGNIGYYAPAWVPVRREGDGSLPVRGDTDDYEWDGYVPFEDLPHSYNPPGGVIVTANSRVVPDGYPYSITHNWAAPWRTARLFRLLEGAGKLDVDDMLRIDMDIYSMEDMDLAEHLLAAAAVHPPGNPELKAALRLLHDWDGNASVGSVAIQILEVVRSVLFERVLKPKLGEDAALYRWAMGLTFVDNAILNNWRRWLPPQDADFNVTLLASLDEALRRISKTMGTGNPAAWKWGTTIPLVFRHPLDGVLAGRKIFDVGPFPQNGMATTVKATTATSGPSMRMVVDFSEFDNSRNNITLGESGQVFSPHYKDQFQAWYTGRSFPMLFTDAAVEKGAVHKLVLEPAQ